MLKRIREKGGLVSIVFMGIFVFPLFTTTLAPSETTIAPSLSPVRSSPLPRTSKRTTLKLQQKKILDILSRFDTGLESKDEERLAVFIAEESRRYGFDPELIIAIIFTESSFYNWSTSPMGAVGLMQIIPTTGKELAEINNIAWDGEDRLLDPFVNIKLGIHYLWTLYLKFGDLRMALAAYNSGPSAVTRLIASGERIPTKYSKKVIQYYKDLLGSDGEAPTGAEMAGKVEMGIQILGKI